MANKLPKDKQIAVISALAEGCSIRAISRITDIHQDTICRLGVWVGRGCAKLLDAKMRGLTCRFLQFDEIWGFIGKKEKHLSIGDDPTLGDVWTFCAIDSETKLVPSFKCGKRTHVTANAFVGDVASRLKNRPQISSDGLRAYVEAVENAFGMNVDFGVIIKNYGADKGEHHQERRYSAPEVTSMQKMVIAGYPETDPHFYQPYRKTERNHALAHAPFDTLNLRIQQEAGKLRGGSGATLRVLQFRALT
jgi:hypothetical protein